MMATALNKKAAALTFGALVVGLALWRVLVAIAGSPREVPQFGRDAATARVGTRHEEPDRRVTATPPARAPAAVPERPLEPSEPPRPRVSEGSDKPDPDRSSLPSGPMPPSSEFLRRADESTGLEGEALQKFHQDFMRGLASFGPMPKVLSREDRENHRNENRARAYSVAEDLLGPERGQAYVDALFPEETDERRRLQIERGRRYTEAIEAGKTPEEAARAAGIIDDDALRDAGP